MIDDVCTLEILNREASRKIANKYDEMCCSNSQWLKTANCSSKVLYLKDL